MSRDTNKLLKITCNYEKIGLTSLIIEAKKKEKKKLDPKAKVRNRGTVCVPAERAKDKKDHFPINDEGQARNALARVHQYSSAPSWYSGSLKGLQSLVSGKVHSKYPGIGKADKKKKKSFVEVSETILAKYGQFHNTVHPVGTPGYNPATALFQSQMNHGDPPQWQRDPNDPATYQTPSTGTSDQYVTSLQKFLTETMETPLVPDGKFGPNTSNALKRWQESNGVEATGKLDENTIAALEPHLNTSASSSDRLFRKYAQIGPAASTTGRDPNGPDPNTLRGGGVQQGGVGGATDKADYKKMPATMLARMYSSNLDKLHGAGRITNEQYDAAYAILHPEQNPASQEVERAKALTEDASEAARNKPVAGTRTNVPAASPSKPADPWITALQEVLMQKGIQLPRFGADGKMGSETMEGLKTFFAQQKTPWNGKWDQATKNSLNPLVQYHLGNSSAAGGTKRSSSAEHLINKYGTVKRSQKCKSCNHTETDHSSGHCKGGGMCDCTKFAPSGQFHEWDDK